MHRVGEEGGGLDGLEVVEAHRDAGTGLEAGVLAVAGAGEHGGVAVLGAALAEHHLELVHAGEGPAGRALGAEHLERVVAAVAAGDAGGLQRRVRPAVEPRQRRDPVLVLHRAALLAHGDRAVADPRTERQGTLGDERVGGRGDLGDALPGDVLDQVRAVGEQIADHAAAALGAVVAPGQRTVGGGGIVGDQPAAHVRDAAQSPGGDQLAQVRDRRGVAVVEAHRRRDPRAVPRRGGGVADLAGLPGIDAHRLLDPERLPGRGRREREVAVQEVRGADRDRLHLRIGEDLVDRGDGLLEPELLARGDLVLLERIRGDDEPRSDPELGEAGGDPLVGRGVQAPHPAQAHHADADVTHVVSSLSPGVRGARLSRRRAPSGSARASAR